jgi:hypothetical protein
VSHLLEKIRSRCYWRVVIRPSKFKKERIPDIAALLPILQKCAVQFRGWDFPHIDFQTPPHIDTDWIGEECEFMGNLELWRFYKSGQFVHVSANQYDWIDPKELKNIWRPDKLNGPLLGISDAVFRFTEIFEFASRLANTDAGEEQMHIDVTLHGLKGRTLFVDSYNRAPMFQPYTASIESFSQPKELPRTSLIAEAKELALIFSAELFKRFGWNPTLDMLRGLQSELYQR